MSDWLIAGVCAALIGMGFALTVDDWASACFAIGSAMLIGRFVAFTGRGRS